MVPGIHLLMMIILEDFLRMVRDSVAKLYESEIVVVSMLDLRLNGICMSRNGNCEETRRSQVSITILYATVRRWQFGRLSNSQSWRHLVSRCEGLYTGHTRRVKTVDPGDGKERITFNIQPQCITKQRVQCHTLRNKGSVRGQACSARGEVRLRLRTAWIHETKTTNLAREKAEPNEAFYQLYQSHSMSF